MTAAAIRAAELDDAVDVARIKIAAWRHAYAGIVPDAVMEVMDDIRTAAFWSNLIEKPRPGSGLLVAAQPGEGQEHAAILGFAHFAPLRPEGKELVPAEGWGELTALYVDPTAQRRGIGRRLLDAAFARLGVLAMASVRIWSLADNPIGNAFYQKCGGVRAATGETQVGGKKLALVAYDWPALATLRS